MRARAQKGEHLTGSTPYGYKKSETDNKQWVIDEEAAKVVREIYRLYIGGMNFKGIAEELSLRGIETPAKHLLQYGLYKYGKRISYDDLPEFWHLGTIIMIIDRYEFAGHTVSCRRKKVSYKTKETASVPKDEWIITRDTQDAIIDEETWQTAHRIRESGRKRKVNIYDKGALNGLIFCSDCGSKLYFKPTTRLKDKTGCYMCGYNLHYKLCSTHYIRRCDLEAAVLADIRRVTAFAKSREEEFVAMVERMSKRSGEDTLRKNETELSDAQTRLNEIDRIINRLYEDKVIGELSAERFATMLTGFEEEQAGLRAKCDELRIAIANDREKTDSAERFIKVVRKNLTDISELTVEMVSTLIEKVLVYQAEKVNGQKVQKVRIIYNFIGDVSEEITE
jgi:hypothetical protein